MIGPTGKPLPPLEAAAHYLAHPDMIYGRETMREMVRGLLDIIEADRRRPDPLGEALNSGDGTYRP